MFTLGEKVCVVPDRGCGPLRYGKVYVVSGINRGPNTIFVEGIDTAFVTWRFMSYSHAPQVPEGERQYVATLPTQAEYVPTERCPDTELPDEALTKREPRPLRLVRIPR
jgi:hypothetical protein